MLKSDMPVREVTVVRRVETKRRWVSLTFDDGPDPSLTATKLRILAEFGARATFFCLGWRVDRFPSLLRQIVRDGHEVGNHTYDHPYLTGLSREEVFSQLERTHRALANAAGVSTRLFRPTYGEYDTAVLDVAGSAGYRCAVLWDIDPSDYLRPAPDTILDHVIEEVRAGSIVVMHDWVAETAEALPAILSELRARGFRAVTVSSLLESDQTGSGRSQARRSSSLGNEAGGMRL